VSGRHTPVRNMLEVILHASTIGSSNSTPSSSSVRVTVTVIGFDVVHPGPHDGCLKSQMVYPTVHKVLV